MPHTVFISYSQADRHVAEKICALLEEGDVPCWMAPRDVAPGRSWPAAIVAAIEACQIMVLVFSEHSNRSAEVHKEVHLAIEEGKTVLPIRLQDLKLDPELRYHLMRVHWMDALTPQLDLHLLQLRDRLRSMLSPAPASFPAAVTPSADTAAQTHPELAVRPAAQAVAPPNAASAFQAAARIILANNLDSRWQQARHLLAQEEASASPLAQNLLGYMLAMGLGGAQDLPGAAIRFAQAAPHLPAAQTNFAVLKFCGQGITKDEIAAAKEFQAAGNRNHPEALLHLAFCYEEARGVMQNVRWANQLRAQAKQLASDQAPMTAANFSPVLSIQKTLVKVQGGLPFRRVGREITEFVIGLASNDSPSPPSFDDTAEFQVPTTTIQPGWFHVVITHEGRNPIEVIKAVRQNTNLPLSEAKALVQAVPRTVRTFAKRSDAEALLRELTDAGASVEIRQ